MARSTYIYHLTWESAEPVGDCALDYQTHNAVFTVKHEAETYAASIEKDAVLWMELHSIPVGYGGVAHLGQPTKTACLVDRVPF